MTWTLRRKTLLGYGIVLGLMLLVMGWALVMVNRLGRASDAILRENYRSIIAAEHMINALERQDSAVLLLLIGDDAIGLNQFRQGETEFLRWLGRAEDNITIEGEGAILDRLKLDYTTYLVQFSELRTLTTNDLPAARIYYHRPLLATFQKVRDQSAALRELNQQVMFEASRRARDVGATASWSILLVGLAAILIGLLFSVYLSGRISRPLRQMMRAVKQIAAGQYEVTISSASDDELGLLAGEFNAMARQLAAYRELNVERMVAEQRKTEAVVDSIVDGLIVLANDLTVADLNRVAARLLAVDREAARGRHLLELLDDRALFDEVRQVVESRQTLIADPSGKVIELNYRDELRQYQYSITPIRGDDAHPGVVLVLSDVTRLKQIDQLKTEFVMTASHELRTPLTGIGMSLGLLREGAAEALTQAQRELLELAEEDTARLKALVNDLLDLSKLEAGRLELDRQPVAVELLIEKALAVMRQQAEEKGLALRREPVPAELRVMVDANKITWVITNLLANALRFTPTGGEIVVSVEPLAQQAQVSVRDTGPGIAPEDQSRVFDKFVQVEGQSTGGTGLGLAICREIVKAHRGSIWVESEVGQGSTFRFTLPLAESEGTREDHAEARADRR